MQSIVTGENAADDVADWVEEKTLRRPVIIQLPQLTIDRNAAVRELIRFELEAIDVVMTRLREDIARLTPFYWQTQQDKIVARATVHEMNAYVNRLERQARAETTAESILTPIAHQKSSGQYTPGLAHRQAVHIQKHGPNCMQFNFGCPAKP